jgi:hypothetical protein
VPEARLKGCKLFQASRRDALFTTAFPGAEAPGYFQQSPRDFTVMMRVYVRVRQAQFARGKALDPEQISLRPAIA